MQKLILDAELTLKLKEMRELLAGVEPGGGDLVGISSCGYYCMVTCSWWCESSCAESCRGYNEHGCAYKIVKPKVTRPDV